MNRTSDTFGTQSSLCKPHLQSLVLILCALVSVMKHPSVKAIIINHLLSSLSYHQCQISFRSFLVYLKRLTTQKVEGGRYFLTVTFINRHPSSPSPGMTGMWLPLSDLWVCGPFVVTWGIGVITLSEQTEKLCKYARLRSHEDAVCTAWACAACQMQH